MHPYISSSLAAQRREQFLGRARAYRALHDSHSFALVLERRIYAPFHRLLVLLTNPITGSVLRSTTAMRFDEPFERADLSHIAAMRTRATLLSVEGKRVARVHVEIAPWSRSSDSDLLIRPDARRPERWSTERVARYFDHARNAADELTDLLRLTTTLA